MILWLGIINAEKKYTTTQFLEAAQLVQIQPKQDWKIFQSHRLCNKWQIEHVFNNLTTASCLHWHDHKVNLLCSLWPQQQDEKTKIQAYKAAGTTHSLKKVKSVKKKLFVNLPSTNFAEIKSNGPVGQWFFTQIFCVASNKRWHIISWNKKNQATAIKILVF